MKAQSTLVVLLCFTAMVGLNACGPTQSENSSQEINFRPRDLADAVHAVAAAHRLVYTNNVVNRLSQAGVVEAHEDFESRQSLLLPAQLFRFSAEEASQKNLVLAYSLKSLWPVNPASGPASQLEEIALQSVANSPQSNYYTEETIDGVRYFLAAYADLATSPSCAECHNSHPQSPKTDFQLNDVMGAVLVRITMN